MARRNKLITREFNLTVGEVLTVNLENRETSVLQFTLTGKYEKVETILEVMKKQIGGNIVPVQIISFENKTKLFGITEEIFLENAIELDRETRKPL